MSFSRLFRRCHAPLARGRSCAPETCLGLAWRILVVLAIQLLVLLALSGCATRTRAGERLALGMTPPQVQRALGNPYSRAASAGVETWRYRETTWDDGGWSWQRTVHDTEVRFENGRVVRFGPAGEHRLTGPRHVFVNVTSL